MSEFQMALLFPFVPVVAFLILELILPGGDDDDDFDDSDGILQPVSVST